MDTQKQTGRISRRLLLGALLSGVAGQAVANAPLRSLRPPPRGAEALQRSARSGEALIADAGLSGKIAYAVADARTGEMLETHNPVLPLPPASVTKAITALYALDRLGPEFRFQTRVMATGPLKDGRLDGDLILVGGGDPTLDTDALGDLAAELKKTGLREISGRFLIALDGFPSFFAIDPDQPDHMGYNPAVSGLNLNYNRVHFEWRRGSGGYDVSMDARAQRLSPAVAIARMEVVDRKMPVYTYVDTGAVDAWTVARAALGKAGSRWLPVRKPELYAAEVFQTLARSHGIVLPKAAINDDGPRGETLVQHQSAALRSILQEMLLWSTNLTAEVVGLAATQAAGGGTPTLKASASAMSDWARERLGARKARFVDHSGLGENSRIAATDMARALAQVREQGILGPILKPIVMRNRQGEKVPNHAVKVRAKTGTLNFVSALSGYLTGPNGRELTFAIFTADLDSRARIPEGDEEAPAGSRPWLARSRNLQMRLLERWGSVYAT